MTSGGEPGVSDVLCGIAGCIEPLAENDRAYIFLVEDANRRRIKSWRRAEAVEDDPDLLANLTDADYSAAAKTRPERAIVFRLEQRDVNCPQHFAPRLAPGRLRPLSKS